MARHQPPQCRDVEVEQRDKRAQTASPAARLEPARRVLRTGAAQPAAHARNGSSPGKRVRVSRQRRQQPPGTGDPGYNASQVPGPATRRPCWTEQAALGPASSIAGQDTGLGAGPSPAPPRPEAAVAHLDPCPLGAVALPTQCSGAFAGGGSPANLTVTCACPNSGGPHLTPVDNEADPDRPPRHRAAEGETDHADCGRTRRSQGGSGTSPDLSLVT